MKLLKFIFLVLLLIGCSTNKSSLHNEESLLDAKTIAKMDALIEKYADNNFLSGVIARIQQNNKVIYNKYAGYQDLENQIPMQENTLFRLASFTKTITSVAAMQLVEKELMRLDDPLYKFIPEFKDVKVYNGPGETVDLIRPITIKHLLMHHSGIGTPFENEPADILVKNHDFSEVNSLDSFVKEFTKIPLAHQPGESFSYGYSTDILARVIEIVSGESLSDYVDEHILKPLKMDDTSYSITDQKRSRLGPAYRIGNAGLEVVIPAGTYDVPFARGATGLTSTTHDYLRFATMMLNNGELDGIKILKPETAQLMHTNQLPTEQLPLTIGGTKMHNNGFGLGFAIVMNSPKKWKPLNEYNMSTIANLPGGCYYWLGAFNNSFWIDPNNNLVGIVMTQSVDVGKVAIFQEFYQEFYKSVRPDGAGSSVALR